MYEYFVCSYFIIERNRTPPHNTRDVKPRTSLKIIPNNKATSTCSRLFRSCGFHNFTITGDSLPHSTWLHSANSSVSCSVTKAACSSEAFRWVATVETECSDTMPGLGTNIIANQWKAELYSGFQLLSCTADAHRRELFILITAVYPLVSKHSDSLTIWVIFSIGVFFL